MNRRKHDMEVSSKVCETNLDEGVLHNSEWIHRWDVGNTAFHKNTHDKFLDEREKEMFDGKTKSLLLPLCGKSHDLLWMYKNGNTVCGVEIAEQPVREIFEENNIEVEVHTIDNIGKLYQSKDGRLKLYVGDLYDMNKEICGQFDIIWDRKSFTAINVADHKIYRDLVLSLMKEDGVYYLSTVEYDPAVWPGPPHTVSDKVVRDVYGDCCAIDLIEETERPGQNTQQAGPASSGGTDGQKLSSAQAALKTSAYVYDRWYKMTLKGA